MSNTLLPDVSRLSRPTSVSALLTAPALIRKLHWYRCRTEEPGYAQSARRLWPDSWRHAVLKHATDKTDPCDPFRMGVKSTTISNHPNTPLKHRVSCPHKTVYILTLKHDTSQISNVVCCFCSIYF